MARKLVEVFREHYKIKGNKDWFDLMTDPYILGSVNDRLGVLLYNKSIDRVASLDDVGNAVVPILSLSDLLPFSVYREDEDALYPVPKSGELIALLCEKLDENTLSSINTLKDNYSIVLVGTLVSIDDGPAPIRHVYLYDKNMLES